MTKYELYQILDENGFEPSEENLEILTEGLESGEYEITEEGVLVEGAFGRGVADVASLGITKLVRHVKAKNDGRRIAKEAALKSAGVDMTTGKGKKAADAASKARDRINKRVVDGEDYKYAETAEKAAGKKMDRAARGMAAQRKLNDNAAAFGKDVKKTTNYKGDAKNATLERYKKPVTPNPATPEAPKAEEKPEEEVPVTPKKGGKRVLKENYSLYELYTILDENGYEPTKENLEILREDLECGDAIILSVADLVLTEDMDETDVYCQILAENGFKINENNIAVLMEAVENGHVLLEAGKSAKEELKEKEEKDEEKKERTKHVAGNVAKLALAGAVGAAAVMGGGAALNGTLAAAGQKTIALSKGAKIAAMTAGAGGLAAAEGVRQKKENDDRQAAKIKYSKA